MSRAISRTPSSRLGITPLDLDNSLYDAFGQRQISTMFTQLNQYRVVLESQPGFQDDPEDLKSVYLRPAGGGSVPLGAFTQVQTYNAPLSVNHQGQFPVVTVSFNLAPGTSLGQAVRAIEKAKAELGMPESVQGSFQGTAQAFRASLSNEVFLILAAIITVLSPLPSAAVGALLSLMLCGTDFSVIALIGIILLIGIVEKNAIMMIDFALDAERNQQKTPGDAIYQACLLRFSPITMTTRAALLGGLPLALGSGTGSELRRPLG